MQVVRTVSTQNSGAGKRNCSAAWTTLSTPLPFSSQIPKRRMKSASCSLRARYSSINHHGRTTDGEVLVYERVGDQLTNRNRRIHAHFPAQAMLNDLLPGCLVLDVRLPGMSRLTFQTELAKVGVDLPVIFITGHGDIRMSVRAMKAGAIEFLTMPLHDQDLLDAIHAAIERDTERRRGAVLVGELRERYATLTERERQIMTLVVSGRANKQIAAELELSEMTVKVHRGQVMRKMQAGSLAKLVRIADRLAALT
jgi:FixJ family two-component response regulator